MEEKETLAMYEMILDPDSLQRHQVRRVKKLRSGLFIQSSFICCRLLTDLCERTGPGGSNRIGNRIGLRTHTPLQLRQGNSHWPIGKTIVMERNASFINQVFSETDGGHNPLFKPGFNPLVHDSD